MTISARSIQDLLEENRLLQERIREFEQAESERKSAAEELRESGERFRCLLQNVPEIAIQGYLLDGTTTYWNQASERLYGYTEEEAIGQNLLDLIIPPEMRNEVQRSMEVMIATGEPIPPAELYLMRKDGSRVAVFSNHALVHLPGSPPELFCLDIDLSDLKQAQEQVRQLHKSESLSRMAGAIAHTFNNQLAVVIGNLELALSELSLSGGLYAKIAAAMQAAGKAAEVSGLMLTYLGHSFEERGLLDLSLFCRRSLTILRASIPENVILEAEFPSPGPTVRANANQLQQVLTNLVNNAWEAVGNSHGSVRLAVKTLTAADIPAMHRFPIDWQPQDDAYACLEVTDTGHGIDYDDIEKLFDPFYSSKFTGRGMGLPVVLGIVRTHGGAAAVESTPGRGSAFQVFFPVSAEEITMPEGKTAPTQAIEKGGTLLLIEDEAMLRTMAATMLKRLGYSVLEARDGVEAVDVFRQCQDDIRCVICDLTMPRMNGWETLTALRKLDPHIPVVLASGFDKAQVMSGNHPDRPQAFLGKPYQLKDIVNAISEALAGKKD